jgi:bacterial/archaeal transporter family protein
MQDYRWLHYAILAAVCAASINIFGKIGMAGLDSDLSTAVRSIVQAVFVVAFATVIGSWSKIGSLSGRPVAITMIILCGVAGGLSWIFAFRALKLADASQVAPIDKLSMPLGILLAVLILHERPTMVNWAGILLIAGGAYLATWPRPKAGSGFPVIPAASVTPEPNTSATTSPNHIDDKRGP